MEQFAEKVEDKIFANKLFYALENRHPFANFNKIVENSYYREKWFNFRTKQIEITLYNELKNF